MAEDGECRRVRGIFAACLPSKRLPSTPPHTYLQVVVPSYGLGCPLSQLGLKNDLGYPILEHELYARHEQRRCTQHNSRVGTDPRIDLVSSQAGHT